MAYDSALLNDPLAWVKTRIPEWQKTNPWIEHDTPEYLAGRIGENGGLNDPVHGAEYWDKRMSTPEPLWSAQNQPPAQNQPSPYMTNPTEDPSQQSDVMAQVMAELQAQQTGDPSPRTRDTQLQMLRGPR